MKINSKLLLLITVIVLSFCYSCNRITKTNRNTFEEMLNENLNACMQPFLDRGVDSASAKEVSICIFETLYELDSTAFLSRDKIRIDELIKMHASELDNRCGKLVEEYVPDSVDTK